MAKAPTTTQAEAQADAIEDAVVIEEAAPPSTAESTPQEAPAEPDPGPSPVPVAPRRRSGAAMALWLVLGGVLAAVIGFAAARTLVPEGWPFPGVAPQPDPLAAELGAQATQIAALETSLASLGGRLQAMESSTALSEAQSALSAQITALEGAVNETNGTLEAITARLEALEKMAPEGSVAAQTAADAYARELANLRQMFAGELEKAREAQAQAAALEASAAAAANDAAARAAVSRLAAALDTGRAYSEPLDQLATLGISLPVALTVHAQAGVPALAALQEGFAPAARAALDAAIRAAVADGSMGRLTAFVQVQLGTRSLEPREGDDADAILSRAEDALRRGALAEALALVDSLPEAARAPMADWRAQAQARHDALAASAALSQQLE